MRDCVFLVADGHMRAVFSAFLGLAHKHTKLGTSPFGFDAERDLICSGSRDSGNDPLVMKHGPSLLRPYKETHRHAVVVLDFAFEHKKTPQEIIAELKRAMIGAGWEDSRFEVVVIQPELEVWLWQDNPCLQEIFYRNLSPQERASTPPLRDWLREQTLWPDCHPKPPDPKSAMKQAASAFRAGSPSAVFSEVFRRISTHGCQDVAFHSLRDALRRWFPVPKEEV